MHGTAAGEWPADRNCCTIAVYPGEDIQQAIDALPPEGGCVCLKSGVHKIDDTLFIRISNVILHGEAPGVRVVATKPVGSMLTIHSAADEVLENIEITHLTWDYAEYFDPPDGPTVFAFLDCRRIRVIHCELLYTNPAEKMLIRGITLIDTNDVAISDNFFDRMYVGVYAFDFATATLFEDNILRGQLTKTEFGMTNYSWLGLRLGPHGEVSIRNNVFEWFQSLASLPCIRAEVVGNQVRPYPLPPGLDAATDVDSLNYALYIATRAPGIVHGNEFLLPSMSYGGVRVGSESYDVTGNTFTSTHGTPSLVGPVGVYVGHMPLNPSAGDSSLIAHNRFLGNQTAVLVWDPHFVHVSDNEIAGGGVAPVGIRLENCFECSVTDNVIRDVALPLWIANGSRNVVTGNSLSTALVGAMVSREGGLELSDNRLDSAARLGIGCEDLRGTAHFSNLRLQNCGYAAPTVALSLAISQSDPLSVLDATIESCDILNTGVAADGTFTPGKAWGIATQYVSHLKISENRVRYPVATPLPATAEHRALNLVGVQAQIVPAPGGAPLERAFGAALISGNVFQGPSRDRLVDVRRIVLSHTNDLRFEKLTFSVNRCDHFGQPGSQNITADLYGSHMIVTSNQVKTPVKGHSFGFGARPRVATTSNYTTGDYVNVATTVPAVLTNFNVIV